MTPPSCVPDMYCTAYQRLENHVVPPWSLVTVRTEPSHMAMLTTDGCWLPYVYQPGGSRKSQAVGRAPAPIQEATKSRCTPPWPPLPPRISPKLMVLEVPSLIMTMRVRESWKYGPQNCP